MNTTAEGPAGGIALTELGLDHGLLNLDTVSGDETDPNFKVSEDVSFPIEVQERPMTADDLRKLVRLFEDGVINEQELEAARAAKLLRHEPRPPRDADPPRATARDDLEPWDSRPSVCA